MQLVHGLLRHKYVRCKNDLLYTNHKAEIERLVREFTYRFFADVEDTSHE